MTETEIAIEESKTNQQTRTARFAQWLMDRESKRQDKESNLEGMIRFNIFLSIATLVSVAGSTVAQYVMMAYAWL